MKRLKGSPQKWIFSSERNIDNTIFSRNTFLTQTNLRHCIPVYDSILFRLSTMGISEGTCAMQYANGSFHLFLST